MQAHRSEPNLVGQQIGKYTVVRQLGEGGMGVVYEAIRSDIGSRAAVKVLRAEFAMNNEIATRFFNEARAANIIEHPSIVKVFDYGQLPSGAAYLAMEFLNGESLYKRLQREKRLSEIDTVRIGRQVATALAAAHAKQVIHRDLKPENIILVPDSETPSGERAKILDFGIAKLASEHRGGLRTDTSVVMGTPIYMSPEQCRGGKSVGDRADVYALGVLLFEMLAGRTPFIAEEAGEYIGMHLFNDPPPIGQLVPGAAVKLQRLIDSMLLKEPNQRPPMFMVAVALRELGMNSSDVESLKAIAAESRLDPETQPLLKLGSAAGLSVAFGKTVPAMALPGASSLGSVAMVTTTDVAALSPLRLTVDPLGDTMPGQAALRAAAERGSPQAKDATTEAQPRRDAALPSPLQPVAASALAPAAKPASADNEAETQKPIAASSLPSAYQEARRKLDRERRKPPGPEAAERGPRPARLPASEIPTIKPGQLQQRDVPIVDSDGLRDSDGLPTPVWQPVHIRSGAHVALDAPTEDRQRSRQATQRPQARAGLPWPRLAQRLPHGLRRLLGLSAGGSGEDEAPAGRTLGPVALGIAALALGSAALAYVLQAPAKPGPPPPAPPAVSSSTAATHPTEPPTAAARPAAVEPAAPVGKAPADSAPPTLPADLAARLAAIEQKADAGKLAAAGKEARALSKKVDHAAVWSALGRYACMQQNAKVATEALTHIAPQDEEAVYYRAAQIAACERQGLWLDEHGSFVRLR